MSNTEIKFKYESLYQYRKEKGISQEELGNIIGVSRQAVSKWEAGERVPDINNLNALCKTFDKTLEDFIEGAEDLIKIEEKRDQSKKFTKIKLFKIIMIILIIIYVLLALIKVLFINSIFFKINKCKDSANYSYERKFFYYDTNGETEVTAQIYFKDNTQRVIERYLPYSSREVYYCIDSEDSYNNEIFAYYFDVNDDLEVNEQYGYYPGDPFYEYSPYNLVMVNIKDYYTISFILNPFKILKIDFKEKDLIIEKSNKQNYEKELVYIDLKTGFLNKRERYHYEKLSRLELYYKFWFDWVDDRTIEITEESKNEIKEKSGTDSQIFVRPY